MLTIPSCPPKLGLLQAEPETPLGLCQLLYQSRDCQKFLSHKAAFPRRKDFQTAFISGNWPWSSSPKEALEGVSAGGSQPLPAFCRGLWFYICGVYNHILERIPVGLLFHMLAPSLFLNVPYVSLGIFFLSHGLIGPFVLPNPFF